MAQDSNSQKDFFIVPHYRLLSLIFLIALLGWGAWLLVIYKFDPYNSPGLALAFFFLSSFFAFSGTFAIILFFLKKWRARDQIYIKHVLISLRQGILLSLCTCLCLALLMLGLLRIWNGLLLVALIMLVEFYLSGKDELETF